MGTCGRRRASVAMPDRKRLIFSGTPQSTTALKPGDVVEVHVDGCGVLSNPVVAEA